MNAPSSGIAVQGEVPSLSHEVSAPEAPTAAGAPPEQTAGGAGGLARRRSAPHVRRRVVQGIVLLAVLAWPLAGPPSDMLSTAVLASQYVVVAVSLVLLVGLVGQISLCQASLVGFGAFVAALGTQHAGLVFPLSIVVGAGAGAAAAMLIGIVALRVRGLFFAVATLIFSYVTMQYLFAQDWLVGNVTGNAIKPEAVGTRGVAPYFDLSKAHDFYYVALAGAVFTVYAVANLRDSRLGRAFAAVRGSEVAAASLGIDVVRTKLVAFAASGGFAGLAGALLLVGSRAVSPQQFDFQNSLLFLAIAVVGGLRSLGGAVSSSLLFAVLQDEVFYRFPAASNYLDIISALLLAVVLLFFRGGLGAVPSAVRTVYERRVSKLHAQEDPNAWLAAASGPTTDEPEAEEADLQARAAAEVPRMDPSVAHHLVHPPKWAPAHVDEAARVGAPASSGRAGEPLVSLDRIWRRVEEVSARMRGVRARTEPSEPDPTQSVLVANHHLSTRGKPLMLHASNITVRFGGLTAVDHAAIEVDQGEIVGLIGPNGAGKTTLFNALLGLNDPAEGEVRLFGHDVTNWPVHKRAALGVGRTFQVLQLFPDLTVNDNLLAATHLKDSTGLAEGIFATPSALNRERANRERVGQVLAAMQLSDIAERTVGSLPFGILRLVEVARTLVAGSPLVCLDEPASGLDSIETERLISWLFALRDIGVTLLVIEHDVPMVTRLCDRIYVLDQGKLIATGSPEEIQRNPAVIASYLGTPDSGDSGRDNEEAP